MSKELADQLECLMKCATLSFTDRELLQRAAELLRRAHGTDSEPATEGKAHYIDCWRNHGHHKCAIDVAEVALAQLSGRSEREEVSLARHSAKLDDDRRDSMADWSTHRHRDCRRRQAQGHRISLSETNRFSSRAMR